MSRVISLLTDFGTNDAFVGIMKGIIYGVCPDARIVDLTHDIEPQNIEAASFAIASSYPYFPKGSIHVVVVDPGVGSERRILCVSCEEHYFLAPDNGVLSYIFDKNDAIEVVNVTERSLFLEHISKTFHGRDIFAPVAAHLANGLSLRSLGPHIEDYAKGRVTSPKSIENGLEGEVVYIDRFGNLITNLSNTSLDSVTNAVTTVEGAKLRRVSCYNEGSAGEPIILPGSAGFLEIAVNAGNAADVLHVTIGSNVRIFWS